MDRWSMYNGRWKCFQPITVRQITGSDACHIIIIVYFPLASHFRWNLVGETLSSVYIYFMSHDECAASLNIRLPGTKSIHRSVLMQNVNIYKLLSKSFFSYDVVTGYKRLYETYYIILYCKLYWTVKQDIPNGNECKRDSESHARHSTFLQIN
jgi:hypothetical protein